MKMIKSSVLLLFVSALFSTSAIADTSPPTPDETKSQLRAEVLKYINDVDLELIDGREVATVSFMVSAKNEIVVLYVESENDDISSIIKRRLNYKKVKTHLKDKNQKYFIDLIFQKEQ